MMIRKYRTHIWLVYVALSLLGLTELGFIWSRVPRFADYFPMKSVILAFLGMTSILIVTIYALGWYVSTYEVQRWTLKGTLKAAAANYLGVLGLLGFSTVSLIGYATWIEYVCSLVLFGSLICLLNPILDFARTRQKTDLPI